jgi:hypothetical protein
MVASLLRTLMISRPQAVPAADLEVGKVVAGCDLEGPGAEGHVYALVSDDRYFSSEDRNEGSPAD